jgi:hypothetical protein
MGVPHLSHDPLALPPLHRVNHHPEVLALKIRLLKHMQHQGLDEQLKGSEGRLVEDFQQSKDRSTSTSAAAVSFISAATLRAASSSKASLHFPLPLSDVSRFLLRWSCDLLLRLSLLHVDLLLRLSLRSLDELLYLSLLSLDLLLTRSFLSIDLFLPLSVLSLPSLDLLLCFESFLLVSLLLWLS